MNSEDAIGAYEGAVKLGWDISLFPLVVPNSLWDS